MRFSYVRLWIPISTILCWYRAMSWENNKEIKIEPKRKMKQKRKKQLSAISACTTIVQV